LRIRVTFGHQKGNSRCRLKKWGGLKTQNIHLRQVGGKRKLRLVETKIRNQMYLPSVLEKTKNQAKHAVSKRERKAVL